MTASAQLDPEMIATPIVDSAEDRYLSPTRGTINADKARQLERDRSLALSIVRELAEWHSDPPRNGTKISRLDAICRRAVELSRAIPK